MNAARTRLPRAAEASEPGAPWVRRRRRHARLHQGRGEFTHRRRGLGRSAGRPGHRKDEDVRSEKLAEVFVEPVDRLLLSLEVEPEDLVERPLVHEHQDTRLKPSHEFEHARYARTVLGIGGLTPVFARHLDDVGETVAVIEQRVVPRSSPWERRAG